MMLWWMVKEKFSRTGNFHCIDSRSLSRIDKRLNNRFPRRSPGAPCRFDVIFSPCLVSPRPMRPFRFAGSRHKHERFARMRNAW